MAEIDEYKVVPLRLSARSQNCHSIFMREHFIRLMDPNKPKGRTLFLLNVPPYVTEDSLSKFFASFGTVIMVDFAEKPGREETLKWRQHCTPFSNARSPYKFKVAYVVFKTSTGLQRAIQVPSIDLFSRGTGESLIESGMQYWHSEYERYILNGEETQILVDKYMAAYDNQRQEALKAEKNTEADADGWVTVGKQGPNAGFEQKESVISHLENKVVRGRKTKELDNFYTFQIRESKMKNIVDLRKKFEEDKRKIDALKKTRRFRPF